MRREEKAVGDGVDAELLEARTVAASNEWAGAIHTSGRTDSRAKISTARASFSACSAAGSPANSLRSLMPISPASRVT